ncbi:MAG: hypothetical protein Q9216_002071 [Gyalolechia sp. 2 TL-2023]
MAEPISFVAAVIAIADLAKSIVYKGYFYLKAVKDCPDDVRTLVAEVNVLCGILNRLAILLRGGETVPRALNVAASQGKNYMGHDSVDDMEMDSASNTSNSNDEPELSSEILETPNFIYQCQRTLEEIQSILHKFGHSCTQSPGESGRTSRFSLSALRRLKPKDLLWPLSKSKTLQLLQTVERHKSTCTIALAESGLTDIYTVLVQAEISNRHLAKIDDKQEKILELQLSQKEEKVLARLSPVDAAHKHGALKRERSPGTGMWLFDLPDLMNWLDDPMDSLWIYGIPGAGKTTLSTLVVDEVFARKRSNTVGTAYFYIRHDDQDSHKPENVLGSIVSQLALQNQEALASLMSRHESLCKQGSATLDDRELDETLHRVLGYFSEAYNMIDGLDESGSCFDQNRTRLIDIISGLHSKSDRSVRTLIFSRDEQDIRNQFTRNEFHTLSIAASSADLRLFTNSWLGRLDIQSEGLRTEIVDTLVNEANGISQKPESQPANGDSRFMWVRAQVDYLWRLPNDVEKRKALKQLPPDLPQTYIRIFETTHGAYPPQTIEYIQRTLKWLVNLTFIDLSGISQYCSKPADATELSLDELCLAICVENESDWPTTDVIPTRKQVLRWLGCLVRWEQTSDTIHLSHFTVGEFLFTDPRTISSPVAQGFLVTPEDEKYIATACLTYMLHRYFDCVIKTSGDEIECFLAENPLYEYLGLMLPSHLSRCNDLDAEGDRLLSRFLPLRPSPAFKLWEKCHVWLNPNDNAEEGKGLLPRFPSPLHFASAICPFSQVERLLSEGADPDADDDGANSKSPTIERRQSGSIRITRKLIESGGGVDRQLPLRCNEGKCVDPKFIVTPLILSILCGHWKTAQLLLYKGAAWNGSAYINLEGAIDLCSVRRLLEIYPELEGVVRNIVDQGQFQELAEVLREWKSSRDKKIFRNEMSYSSMSIPEDPQVTFINAFSQDQWQNVKRVLTLHPDLDYAIHYAARCTDDTLEFILQYGAKPNVISLNRCTALHIAAQGGYVMNIRLLLQFSANLEPRNSNGWTPLLASVSSRHIGSVDCLLESGANINAVLNGGESAMHIAIMGMDKVMISTLLERGFDGLGPDNHGTTPLHLACEQDDESVVERLIKSVGLPIGHLNANSLTHGTPLYIAAHSGFVSMMNLLLLHGAEIDLVVSGNLLGSALMAACARGQTKAVECLISSGAALEVEGSRFKSAEGTARAFRHEGVLKVLEEHGRKTMPEKEGRSTDGLCEGTVHSADPGGTDVMDIGE